jgi:hypothetical protein
MIGTVAALAVQKGLIVEVDGLVQLADGTIGVAELYAGSKRFRVVRAENPFPLEDDLLKQGLRLVHTAVVQFGARTEVGLHVRYCWRGQVDVHAGGVRVRKTVSTCRPSHRPASRLHRSSGIWKNG